jgi:formamidopyrimidine-DNA glycosylase
VPELPEVERLRTRLEPAMVGARFGRVVLNRPDLRRPLPRDFGRRLRRQTVRSLTRRGKYLLAALSSGDTLIMHLGMSGWLRVEPSRSSRRRAREREADGPDPHDHVLFRMSSGMTVVFNDPRRFGMIDLVSAGRLAQHPSVGRLGPEPLSRTFTARALAVRFAHRRVALKVALLDQRNVAGIGNIYASEALHLARLSPFRPAATLATVSGEPTPGCRRLTSAIKSVLRHAIAREDEAPAGQSPFRVYDRESERCPRAGCGGRIARVEQAGRSTFYCPVCQR